MSTYNVDVRFEVYEADVEDAQDAIRTILDRALENRDDILSYEILEDENATA